MSRLFGLLILVALPGGNAATYAEARPFAQGCACHCDTDTATVRIWQSKEGRADDFVARVMRRWYDRLKRPAPAARFNKMELLIVLGRSAGGTWSVESLQTDAGGTVYSDLVCTTIASKRKVFRLVTEFENPQSAVKGSSLAALVLRRLRQLARRGRWDAGSLTPVQLPLLSKPPALIVREQGEWNSNTYHWRLRARAKDGRLVPVVSRGAEVDDGWFAAAKAFGGVVDEAGGEVWWILIKTTAVDNCLAGWRSVRLPRTVPAK